MFRQLIPYNLLASHPQSGLNKRSPNTSTEYYCPRLECPTHFRNLWSFAVSEVNQAGQSPDPVTRNGAEIMLALLPNILPRAPSAEERLMSNRQKMDSRFAKFFSGDFTTLVNDIPSPASEHTKHKDFELPELTV